MTRRCLALVLLTSGALSLMACRPGGDPALPAVDAGWSVLDAQSRCDSALDLITWRERWPTKCRWREPGEGLQGRSFPPPRGAPPYDDPHVAIFVAPDQSRDQLANVIAHEFGHMHHTREPAFVAEWLGARGLAPDTPDAVWTEDYAEVFAALFSPPAGHWRAPTARPGAEALAGLRARFFP